MAILETALEKTRKLINNLRVFVWRRARDSKPQNVLFYQCVRRHRWRNVVITRLIGVILACVISTPAYSNNLSIGYIAGSYHFDRDATPRNENQEGIYLLYDWFAIGRYRNTMGKTSRFVGGQWKISTYKDIANYFSAILADAYRGHEDADGDYILIPSIKMQYGYGWVSVAPKGIFFGLEYRL